MNTSEILLTGSGLVKNFGSKVAVDHVDIKLRRGEILAILGPSGCGKSTLLRIIAGLAEPDAGSLRYCDELWAAEENFVPPERRDCGMVFQDAALFPHLNTAENIGFALGWRGRRKSVDAMLELVDLQGLKKRMVYQLSGGQQQRVALARSLAPGPGLLLLDEPFSSLDLKLRQSMRREVRRILKTQEVTAVLVTHDQNEAFSVADRVAVMAEGKIGQQDVPEVIYRRPATRTIAAFVGDANFLPMGEAFLLFPQLQGLSADLLKEENELMCRPEELVPLSGGTAAVTDAEFQGAWQELVVGFPWGTLRVCNQGAELYGRGDELGLELRCGCVYSPAGDFLARFSVQSGEITLSPPAA